MKVSVRLRSLAKKAQEVLPFEKLKEYLTAENKKRKEFISRVIPFSTEDLNEKVNSYFSQLKDKAKDLKDKLSK